MTIVAVRGTVGIRSADLVALITGYHIGFVQPVILVISVSIVYPSGPGGGFAPSLSKMTLGAFFVYIVAIGAGIQCGRRVKVGAFPVQPGLSQDMGFSVTVAVVTTRRSGAKTSFHIMTNVAYRLIGFEFHVTVLAVLPICIFWNPAAVGTEMAVIASENAFLSRQVNAVARFTDFRALLLGNRAVKFRGFE